jgi:multiple sugar transport system permease protein
VAVSAEPVAAGVRVHGRRRPRRRKLAPWLLMTPTLLLLAALTLAPAAYLIYSSFFDFTLLGTTPRQYVGLQNYADVFSTSTIRHGFLVTILFVVLAVSIEMVVGMLLAVPLVRRTRGNAVASTLLLLPFAVTPAVSAIIWRQLLDPNFGWVDYYLQKVGLMGSPVEWLSHDTTAWIALIGLDVWQWTPFVALVLMAGLQGMPEEPRQAAAVDGASAWQQFRYITLPLLRPFIAIALLLRLVEAFKTFATVDVLTGGGPGRSTELISLTIHRVALEDFAIGAAAALGVTFLILLLIIVPAVLRAVTGTGEVLEDRT